MLIAYIVHIIRKISKETEKILDEEKHKIYVIIQWILLTDVDVFLTFYLLQWVKNLKGSGSKAQFKMITIVVDYC